MVHGKLLKLRFYHLTRLYAENKDYQKCYLHLNDILYDVLLSYIRDTDITFYSLKWRFHYIDMIGTLGHAVTHCDTGQGLWCMAV